MSQPEGAPTDIPSPSPEIGINTIVDHENGNESILKQEAVSPTLPSEAKLDTDTAREQEISRLSGSVEKTKADLDNVRGELGLSSLDTDPPSVALEKEKLEKLQNEQDELEPENQELLDQEEEKEKLIQEEKEKILQERLDELFKEFESLIPDELESIFNTGKTLLGGNVESRSMGPLDPEIAQTLVQAFREGNRLLPQLLEIIPEILKKLDEEVTKEATERVEKKLEEKNATAESAEEETEEDEPVEIKTPEDLSQAVETNPNPVSVEESPNETT